MRTAARFLTSVIGANIGIVAIGGPARLTGTIGADVPISAGEVIVAGDVIIGVYTANVRRAGVIGAPIRIVADYWRAIQATPPSASLIGSTLVAIITGHQIVYVEATYLEITVIIGA